MIPQSALYAEIGVSGTSYGFDKKYGYLVPDEFKDIILCGERVTVPFGRGNKKRIGIVLSLSPYEDTGERKLKYISSLIDKEPVIGEEMQQMLIWLHDATFCTYYEAFRALIPPGLNVSCRIRYSLGDSANADKVDLSSGSADLYSSFCEVGNRREQEMMISSAFEGRDRKFAEELLSRGFIYRSDEVKRRVKDAAVRMIRLSPLYYGYSDDMKLTAKQKKVAEVLEENGAAAEKELCYLCGITSQVIKNMLKGGIIETFEIEEIPVCSDEAEKDPDSIVLTAEQQTAYDGIAALVDGEPPACALLYGVTGSGKSLVFAKLIKHTLDIGKNVIMMIPEISLTPQTVSRFRSLFGGLVSVIHSGLSMTARLNEYKRIKTGNSRIVVGTRSAVFSPLENIGLIIMDEEGESAYKSESAPRYSARDAAKKRCAYHNAVLLLASATPSVESRYYAEKGKYYLFRLTSRYNDRPLPAVKILDMTVEPYAGTSGLFSVQLADGINENIKQGKQSVLLLNRRGYHTYISCSSCRKPLICPNCSIPLTYHKKNGRLMCHYCGYSTEMIAKCPECGSEKLRMTGLGTQKLEDELSLLFPSARVLRMDADTSYSRYAYEKSFADFAAGAYDIMIGTQMIAKGLDFPNVTLVGVLSVDKALFCGDYRSYERTFSLITQVVGRGGRGTSPGRAYIQTCVPDHYIINLASAQDYDEFYRQESALRKALIFPPYCDICAVGFSSADDEAADKASRTFLEILSQKVKEEDIKFPLRVLGPARCAIEKIKGKFRYRLIIKCRSTADLREFISRVMLEFLKMREFSKVSAFIDINGDIGI